MNIFVGNIPRETSDMQIREVFEEHGKVNSVTLIKDRYTNVLKGFGFIEMPNEAEAEKAIKNLDGAMFHGRPLTVNQAKRKTEDNNNHNNYKNYYRQKYQSSH